MQSVSKQIFINGQYIYMRRPSSNFRELEGGFYMPDSQTGVLEVAKRQLKGGHQAKVCSDHIVLMMVK
jgi:hypothetical protein